MTIIIQCSQVVYPQHLTLFFKSLMIIVYVPAFITQAIKKLMSLSIQKCIYTTCIKENVQANRKSFLP